MPIPSHDFVDIPSERGTAFLREILREIPNVGGELPGWTYYLLCGLFFISCGLITGYFIWRKGYMQTLDAESEVRETGNELQRLREDLQMEEQAIGLDRDVKDSGKEASVAVTTNRGKPVAADPESRVSGITPA